MQLFSVSSVLPNGCQTWWKGSHSRAWCTKTKWDLCVWTLDMERWDTKCMHLLLVQKHTERQWQKKRIYIDANIYSAWGPWSKDVDKPWGKIQRLCFALIAPLNLWVLAKGLWTHSTVERNETLNRSIVIHRLSKHQQNLEGSSQGRVQTVKSRISSSLCFLLLTLSLPPSCWGSSNG